MAGRNKLFTNSIVYISKSAVVQPNNVGSRPEPLSVEENTAGLKKLCCTANYTVAADYCGKRAKVTKTRFERLRERRKHHKSDACAVKMTVFGRTNCFFLSIQVLVLLVGACFVSPLPTSSRQRLIRSSPGW